MRQSGRDGVIGWQSLLIAAIKATLWDSTLSLTGELKHRPQGVSLNKFMTEASTSAVRREH